MAINSTVLHAAPTISKNCFPCVSARVAVHDRIVCGIGVIVKTKRVNYVSSRQRPFGIADTVLRSKSTDNRVIISRPKIICSCFFIVIFSAISERIFVCGTLFNYALFHCLFQAQSCIIPNKAICIIFIKAPCGKKIRPLNKNKKIPRQCRRIFLWWRRPDLNRLPRQCEKRI